MEFFKESAAVRLKTHLDKYLVADDDQLTVRQSQKAGATRPARWLVELVDSNPHVIRLKSCYGRYLTASAAPFLLGMTGNKVLQTSPENAADDLTIEWQPIRDGFQVKLKATAAGTFLRANGATPPWRNTVTHDGSFNSSTANWILWDVEEVEVPEDEELNDYLWLVSSFSSVSDELSRLELGSPASVHSSPFSPRTPRLSMKKYNRAVVLRRLLPVLTLVSCSASTTMRLQFQESRAPIMDLFRNAKAVRLKSHHNKYLHAADDEESVSQDRSGAAASNRWTVEFVTDAPDSSTIIRLKSCYNKYLTASNQPFLLGMTGRKVLQTVPQRLDSSVEWEPIREGGKVKLRTRYGQYLRGNGGLPPWRNSVTHDIPHRTATQEWVQWEVDVVDIVVQSPAPRAPPRLIAHSDSFTDSDSGSPTTNWSKSPTFSGQESGDSHHNSPLKREEGRTIYYHVISDDFGVTDENAQGFCINFKGNSVDELTRKLEEETGIENITVCSRSPLNNKLYPLRLHLPPNNVTMKVVVVQDLSQGVGDV